MRLGARAPPSASADAPPPPRISCDAACPMRSPMGPSADCVDKCELLRALRWRLVDARLPFLPPLPPLVEVFRFAAGRALAIGDAVGAL